MILPIDPLHDAFLDALAGKRPVVVTAPTGSGKSTRLPLWMHEELERPILVVEPRRVACRGLATYLARSRGEELASGVGYRIRFEDRWAPGGRILFATPGVALRMLRDEGLGEFSAVCIDEFHERRWDCDLLLCLLRSRHPGLPLVLTSATLDGQALALRLGGPWLRATGRSHPVRVIHESRDGMPRATKLEDRVEAGLRRVLDEVDGGDVLVFLPGKGEIERCHAALGDLARDEGWEIRRVHGAMPMERLSEALSDHEGRRRILLATNVAETSLTLPGVRAVVDSGLVRMRRHRGGRSALVLEACAADSMAQRRGRAGRVAPGLCLCLWGSSFRPDSATAPELLRCELDDCLLQAAACGIDLGAWDEAPWPSVPPPFAVEAALVRLKDLGALDLRGRITARGQAFLRLPMSVHEARLLVDAPDGLAPLLCDLVALLQGRGRLLPPLLPGDEAHRADARKAFHRRHLDELHAALSLVRGSDCPDLCVNRGLLEEIRAIARALRALLGVEPVDPCSSEPLEWEGREVLARHLLRVWPEAGFVERPSTGRRLRSTGGRRGRSRGPRRATRIWSNGAMELRLVAPASWLAGEEEGRPLPRAGLVLDMEYVAAGGLGSQARGRMVLPCSLACLADAGLGEVEIAEARLEGEGETRRIVARWCRRLARVTLDAGESVLSGRLLRRALARLVLDGRFLPGVGEVFRDDLHFLKLLRNWPGASSGFRRGTRDLLARTELEFLELHLEGLGVEGAEEPSLLGPADFRLEAKAFGTWKESWLERLRRDFPRRWQHDGATFTTEVDGVAGVVDLVALDEAARGLRKLSPLFLPPFRQFRVRLRRGRQFTPLR